MGRTCVHVMPGRPASGDGRWEMGDDSPGSLSGVVCPYRALQSCPFHPTVPIYPPYRAYLSTPSSSNHADHSLPALGRQPGNLFPRCPSPLSLTYSLCLSCPPSHESPSLPTRSRQLHLASCPSIHDPSAQMRAFFNANGTVLLNRIGCPFVKYRVTARPYSP